MPQSKKQRFGYVPRYNTKVDTDKIDLADGTARVLITGGIILNVESADGKEATEFAADTVVAWIRGAGSKGPLNGLVTESGKTEVEVYMAGNVIVRSSRKQASKVITQTLRAEEVYYDAEHNRCVAIRADLEMALPGAVDPLHMRGEEVRRLDLENWEILHGSASSSKLPSDPGLRLDSQRFTLSERKAVRRNVFGIPIRDLRTGEKVEVLEQIVTGENVVTRLEGIPTFFTPTLRTNANDPLGPLQSIGYGQARQFGPSVYTTWDLFELLACAPPPNHTWRLEADYLGKPRASPWYRLPLHRAQWCPWRIANRPGGTHGLWHYRPRNGPPRRRPRTGTDSAN